MTKYSISFFKNIIWVNAFIGKCSQDQLDLLLKEYKIHV